LVIGGRQRYLRSMADNICWYLTPSLARNPVVRTRGALSQRKAENQPLLRKLTKIPSQLGCMLVPQASRTPPQSSAPGSQWHFTGAVYSPSLLFSRRLANPAKNYVVIVKHDLIILDFISDYVVIMYGEPGVYGISSKPYSTRAGINNYLKELP